MRWPVVAIVAYVVLGLEVAVKPALTMRPQGMVVSPTFVAPFIAFIALSGPTVPVLWVALGMGLIVDLYSPRGNGSLIVAGPYALGYMAAAYLTLVMRGMMFRRSALSMVFLSVIGTAAAELVVVTLMKARSIYTEPEGWQAGQELAARLLSALYTAATAGAMALVLFPMSGLFGFQDLHSRRFNRKSR